MNNATPKMKEFAAAIADELGLQNELTWLLENGNFNDISEFISDNKYDYYQSIKDRDR